MFLFKKNLRLKFKMKVYLIVTRIIFLSSLYSSFGITADRCCEISGRQLPSYRLSQHGKRLSATIISREKVADLEICEKFALSKKALAFNFREAKNADYRRRHSVANCQALECPVMNDFTKFRNDTGYNYYSLYRSRRSSEIRSLSCLPRVGVFYISEESMNYTDARESCRKMGATLAHIASEKRTEGLGKMILQAPVFVGLSSRDKDRLWKNEFDEPLSCFDYRGWAELEPAHSRGCAVLVSPENPRSSSTWRVSACSRKLPYICEIMPHRRE